MNYSDFIKELKELISREPKGYDTDAVVTRIEDDIAWVHIAGGDDETPVKLTIDAHEGDTVQVRLSGGNAFLVGNATAPPTDDTTAVQAHEVATEATVKAEQAQVDIDEQKETFWHDDSGAHILGSKSGYRTDLRSDGMHIVKNDTGEELTRFTVNGLAVKSYDGNGNEVEIAHLGYDEGNDDSGGAAVAPYVTLCDRTGDIGNYSTAEGEGCEASGYASHAEGVGTVASQNGAHAEGSGTTAYGHYSHAEGADTTASGYYSHAEGNETTASGYMTHAEGNGTTASGYGSHASGNGTKASGMYQTVIGEYNVEDSDSDYAFIIGNGTSGSRSNALAVDWEGRMTTPGGSVFCAVKASDYSDADELPLNSNAYISSDSTAASWSHLPNGNAGHLLTFGAENRAVQFYVNRNADSDIFIRNSRTGTWSAWRKIVTQSI